MCSGSHMTTLVLPQHIREELACAADETLESGAVLLVSIASHEGSTRVLGREIYWVPEDAYTERHSDSMKITPAGYLEALRRAEKIGATALWCHTHPSRAASPEASKADKIVDAELAEVFRIRTGSEHYGAMIVAPRENGFTFSGFIETVDARIAIDLVGANSRAHPAASSTGRYSIKPSRRAFATADARSEVPHLV
jgi:hypothetical protein